MLIHIDLGLDYLGSMLGRFSSSRAVASSWWLDYVILSFTLPCFCVVFVTGCWSMVGLSSWSHSRHYFEITGPINKPVIHTRAHACTRKPVMWTKRGDFWDYFSLRQKRNNRKLCRTENWHKCTAITTQPDPTVVSIHITTASLPRQTGPLPRGTTQTREEGKVKLF